MLDKNEILLVIVVLLFAFYLVISLGARTNKNSSSYKKVTKYLFGVRILIMLIAIVSLILWVLV